jgi:hypothetical protein
MRARLIKLVAGVSAVAALAFGGVSIAGAASKAPPVNPPVQVGDQTAPDAAGASESATAESATAESATAESASASESAAASDGPGGYADDPANASADTQQQGEN